MSALVDPADLVGTKEAIAASGLSKARFQVLAKSHRIPKPLITLACGPIWARSQIENWAAEHAAQRP